MTEAAKNGEGVTFHIQYLSSTLKSSTPATLKKLNKNEIAAGIATTKPLIACAIISAREI